MLDTLENKLEEYIDRTPFIAKLFFSYEMNGLKDTLKESKLLRASYTPTEDWYINYGRNLTKGFNSMYNLVDRTYATYDAIKTLPLIGEPICSYAENYFSNTLKDAVCVSFVSLGINVPNQNQGKIRIPHRQTTLNVLQSTHSFAVESICAHYEATTNESAENIRSQINIPLTTYVTDPSPLRGAFIYALESIGSFFEDLFGGSNVYSTNYS